MSSTGMMVGVGSEVGTVVGAGEGAGVAVGIAVGAGVEVTTGAGVDVPCVLWLDRQPAKRSERSAAKAKSVLFKLATHLEKIRAGGF